MIYVKQHNTEKGRIIAMCDEGVVGKVLTEGAREIDLQKYSDFYKGKLITPEQAEEEIGEDPFFSANIVGKDAVDVFIKKGVVQQESVSTIAGVPFVHIYSIE